MRLKPIVVPAVAALRTYWKTALLLIATTSAALITAIPVTSLSREGEVMLATRLVPAAPITTDLGLAWSRNAHTPAVVQDQAITLLFQLLMGTAIAVLLIGLVTLLTLGAAREAERGVDIAVRRMVGASHRGLLLSAVLEAATIAAVGTAVGGTLGVVIAGFAARGWPGPMNWTAPGHNLAPLLPLATAIFLGAVFPLLMPKRKQLAEVESKPVGLFVPAMQLGISLAVLTASALVAKHVAGLVRPSPAGGNGEVFRFTLADTAPAQRSAQFAVLLERLKSHPELGEVSLSNPGALLGLGMTDHVTTDCGACSEGLIALPFKVKVATHQFVSADSFQALGVRLVAGRSITADDRWEAPRVAVVNRQLAARHFQFGQAIGRQMQVGDDRTNWYTVVGIVDDAQPRGLGANLEPPYTVYLSVLQHPIKSAELLIRSGDNPLASPIVRRAIEDSFGNSPPMISSVSESDLLRTEAAPLLWFARWFRMEGWGMLLIAAAGTFVLIRLWVISLLPELGMRRAVGARRRHLFWLILSRAAGVGLAGTALGVYVGPVLWDSLTRVVAGLPQWDSGLVARFALLLIATTMAGALIPAWRASRMTAAALIGSAGD